MLVLKRKEGETILLSADGKEMVEVKLIEIAEGRAKIGIEAPKSITILRKEVFDQTKEENKEALSQQRVTNMDALKKFTKKNK